MKRPEIVVLDGITLAGAVGSAASRGGTAPGSTAGWAALEELGTVTVFDRTSEHQVVDRARDAAVVLTNKTPLTADSIAQLPGLTYIGVLATGVDVVDLEAAAQHRIVVTNAPGYGTDSVAQHTFALLLELTNQIAAHHTAARRGDWSRCADFSLNVAPITELAGKTLGIVGLGAIGRRVAQIGSALGMRVAAAGRAHTTAVDRPALAVRRLGLEQLAAAADVLTLHCPLTRATRHLVDAPFIAQMKPTSFLINTSRGELVDQTALATALSQNQIAGAGLDVLDPEPPAANNPLLAAPRCVITPHVAWTSEEARRRLIRRVVDNLAAFLAGAPINVVSPRVAPPPQRPGTPTC